VAEINVKESIKELEKLAEEVLTLKSKSRPRRPIVIEFCGSPKSGKSSSINSLNIFFKRNGFKTKVVTERASTCPVKDKFNPFFNVWTSCSTIAELATYLANNSKELDVIIADRGIFDALFWFSWQYRHNHLDKENYETLVYFLTMKKWRKIFDFIYVFTAEPKVSLKREYANLLTRKYGSVMNDIILKEFNESIEDIITNYSRFFSRVEKIDTSKIDQAKVSYIVTKSTLQILKQIIMEQIGYLEVAVLNNFRKYDTFKIEELIQKKIQIKYDLRDIVENADDFVQPIPIVVFTNLKRDKVLVFKKSERSLSPNSPEQNKILLYAGGHVRKEDSIENNNIGIENMNCFLSIAKSTLSREVNEELGISFYPNENNPFLIWVKDHPKSKKHLAICFVSEVNFDRFTIRLNEDEFIRKKGKSKSGTIVNVNSLANGAESLDSWSKIILKNVFGVEANLSIQPQLWEKNNF